MVVECVGVFWRVVIYLNCDYGKFVIFKRIGRIYYNYFFGEEIEILILIFGQNFKFQNFFFQDYYYK